MYWHDRTFFFKPKYFAFCLQAKLIQKFMSQMASIQEELHGVAQTQADMAGMLQQQEEQLRAERSKYDELKRKYKVGVSDR